jgi:hypothetical protein
MNLKPGIGAEPIERIEALRGFVHLFCFNNAILQEKYKR